MLLITFSFKKNVFNPNGIDATAVQGDELKQMLGIVIYFLAFTKHKNSRLYNLISAI